MAERPCSAVENLTDEELHARFIEQNDQRAAELLNRRYFRLLCYYASRVASEISNEAEDVANKAMHAILCCPSLKGEKALRRFAFAVTHKRAIDALRRHLSRGKAETSLAEVREDFARSKEALGDAQTERSELRHTLDECVRNLTADQRAAVLLVLEEFDWNFIGRNLGRTFKAAQMLFNRARLNLKRCLETKGIRPSIGEGLSA